MPSDLGSRNRTSDPIRLYAEQVLGDPVTALCWLASPQFAFGGKTPRELLSSEMGRQKVRDLLRRIEHGLVA